MRARFDSPNQPPGPAKFRDGSGSRQATRARQPRRNGEIFTQIALAAITRFHGKECQSGYRGACSGCALMGYGMKQGATKLRRVPETAEEIAAMPARASEDS